MIHRSSGGVSKMVLVLTLAGMAIGAGCMAQSSEAPSTEPVQTTQPATTPPATTPSTVSEPSQMSPPVLVEPSVSERTVPRIQARQSTPAGAGAGPGTPTYTKKITNTAAVGAGPSVYGDATLPKAGSEMGWCSIAGVIMTGVGVLLRRKRS